MLQQMSSPSSVQIGEVANIVRPFEGRLYGDASSEASSDAAEDVELPQCKIKRNYNCTKCTFYTQNPRAYLLHIRDVHFERFKIFDCPHCVYASKHHQKLLRHIKMVHGETSTSSSVHGDLDITTVTRESSPRIEDLVEEIEECEDVQMETEDCNQDSLIHPIDMDIDTDRTEETGPSETAKDNKYFSCNKCNYVTHIRSRHTKHVKYHSMPMIKCTICEFRTPYKWNLDRHMKNHGGSGNFECTICNFTADIRQSLTVHEMNHHIPFTGQSTGNRRRNRVGASDLPMTGEPVNSLISREEDSDSRSSQSTSDMGPQYPDIELVSCNSESNDGTSCDNFQKNNMKMDQDLPSQQSPNYGSDESKSSKTNKKIPRPIPQLIPLNTSTPTQKCSGEPPIKKIKEASNESTESNSCKKYENLPVDITITPVNNTNAKETVMRKKNESFFDRLKERLLTETGNEGSLVCKDCGFESKCLSEHSVHEKNCTAQTNRSASSSLLPNLSSTRCQNCRHRCKSSADLHIHMQTCKKIIKNEQHISNDQTDLQLESESEPHPMENVVFVWNNINQNSNKFETPLDININDDSTLPDANKNYDADNVEENDSMSLSPSQAMGKKVFKCPHCPFWASTASRFHVHIVGHLNKKPFECSLCKYKSNWRWDITKHIKLKSARDPEHNEAKVLMTDETGRRNYSKYNKFLAMSVLNENGQNEFHYIDQHTTVESSMETEDSHHNFTDKLNPAAQLHPLNLQTQNSERYTITDNRNEECKKPKKTLWKCKKCNYRDPSKEALLEHVRQHAKSDSGLDDGKKGENSPDPADLAYRCGHCNQLSNWKHVIQRHCRLKHEGIIKVITTVKPKCDTVSTVNEVNGECTKCPFRTTDKKAFFAHLQQHQPTPQAIFKCFICPYFVKDDSELVQHLMLHGVNDPEEYVTKNLDHGLPLFEQSSSSINISTKRHKCTECPYETNSKSQYMYHEQFHKISEDTPYKCHECNYSVSKRHLLHQHWRVHGIVTKKETDEADSLLQDNDHTELKPNVSFNIDEIQYVWVSAKNEFHKMYKCRYCSYVNTQKTKIPVHEKIHCLVSDISDITVYKCLECKFSCDTAGKLTEHSKLHNEIYGRIYCPVDEDVPDEEQIAKLRKVIENEKLTDEATKSNEELKILYFCQKCPARFFFNNELKDHDQFHILSSPNKCKNCDFSVQLAEDLITHSSVHTDEYHTKTKMLKFIHKSHPYHKEPKVESVNCLITSEIQWIVSNPGKNYQNITKKETKHVPKQYFCKECPAKFFKSSALNYHMNLHGGEGDYKCKKCTYTVKNIGNLAKHELLHENETKTCDFDSGDDLDYKNIPLSGTDLFQRKTEAQKRVSTDKDKLVKPNDHFPPVLQADPQFGYLMHGNPEFIYPTYLKNGRQKEKRYKCHKCPSAFEKREQYKIHLSLHGSKQRYKCELCDYSVKYYANYVQHMRKHQMNDEAQAERKKSGGYIESEFTENNQDGSDNVKLAIKTMPKGLPKSDFQQFSISDQQTLRLLQRRRSINNFGKDINPLEPSPPKERKLHLCLLCPYTNQRQDALSNHYKRHEENILNGTHKCSYCDLVVLQSHFLREHLKTHFSYQKNLNAECYVANENVTFTITKVDEDNEPTDLNLENNVKNNDYSEEKLFVNIQTGELVVE